jgi:hypothetical protein
MSIIYRFSSPANFHQIGYFFFVMNCYFTAVFFRRQCYKGIPIPIPTDGISHDVGIFPFPKDGIYCPAGIRTTDPWATTLPLLPLDHSFTYHITRT